MAYLDNTAYNPSFNRNPLGGFPAHRDDQFVSLQAGTFAYLLEDEINELQWLQSEARAQLVRDHYHTGFLDLGYNDYDTWFNGLLWSTSLNKLYPRSLLLHPDSWRTVVNGYPVNTFFNILSAQNSYNLALGAAPTVNVTPALPNSARDDLVFLEVWFSTVTPASTLRYYGGLLNSGNPRVNDLIDPRIGAETSQRVQLRWNIRVIPGVDFTTYPEGFAQYGDNVNGSPNPLCDLSSPNGNWYYHQPNPEDDPNLPPSLWAQKGIYVAGDGSTSAQEGLGTPNGVAYALPLFKIRNRNTQLFHVSNNPLGAPTYVLQPALNTTVYPSGTTTFNLNNVSGLVIGQPIKITGAVTTYYSTITGINVTNNTVTVALGLSSAQVLTYVESVSDRPDGLFNNIVDISDVVDLRHVVSVSDDNISQLLSQGLEDLFTHRLTTTRTERYTRDLIGLPLFQDDAYTLLLAQFSNSTTATSNGTVLTEVVPSQVTYTVSPTGQGLTIPSGTNSTLAPSYQVNIASNTTSFTFECLLKPTWAFNTNVNYGLLTLSDSSNNRQLSLQVDAAASQVLCYLNSVNGLSQFAWQLPTWFNKDAVNGTTWHKLWFGFTSTGNLNLTIDGVQLASVGTTVYPGPWPVNITQANLGYSIDNGVLLGATISSARLSNLLRGESQLPIGYSGYQDDHILAAPDGIDPLWSDATGPYGGLSYPPSQLPAQVLYNNTTLTEYLGTQQGATATTLPITNDPIGAMDTSGWDVSLNGVLPSGQTSVTLPIPFNVPNGLMLFNTAQPYTVNSNTDVALNLVPAGLNVNLNSAPSSNTEIIIDVAYGAEHAHLIPSSKGLVIHNWYDQTYGVQYSDNPTTAPTLTPEASGSLVGGSGTMYYVGYTWYTANGETQLSPQASILLTTGYDSIQVVTPSLPGGVEGIKVYIAEGTNALTLSTVSTATTITLLTLPASGSALPPTSNTAQITSYTNELVNGMGNSQVIGVNHVRVTPNGSNVHYIIPPTGLTANVNGGPGFSVPAWTLTNSINATVILPNSDVFLTWSGPLPNGTIVDIIYEYEIVPNVGDQLLVNYASVPYQGLLNNELTTDVTTHWPLIKALDHLIVNTNGTGVALATTQAGYELDLISNTLTNNSATTTFATGNNITTLLTNLAYAPLSTVLPLGTVSNVTNSGMQVDSALTSAILAFSDDADGTNFAGVIVPARTQRNIVYSYGTLSGNPMGVMNILHTYVTNLQTGSLAPRGMSVNNNVFVGTNNNVAVLYHPRAFTASTTKQVIFAAVIQAHGSLLGKDNDELLLLILSRLDNSATASLSTSGDWQDVAVDVFHLPGRPLLR